ncbi:LacI family transcriptional regulator [Gillisia sp. CAL575]|uniref:LacI family transcriptional regulator n=1 Tax=Gillisia sp. CAL575 TaxID=985255 RepID=UPI0003A755BC|nr:LacI family transcriptional regulator [Gillisia sp. CAL575]
MSSIENHLDEKGYKLITSLSNESIDKYTKSLKKMGLGYIDGLIICPSKAAELKNEYTHIESLLKKGTPVVVFDRICEGKECDKVIIDDYETSFKNTELLVKQKNCKNVIMIYLIDSLHH